MNINTTCECGKIIEVQVDKINKDLMLICDDLSDSNKKLKELLSKCLMKLDVSHCNGKMIGPDKELFVEIEKLIGSLKLKQFNLYADLREDSEIREGYELGDTGWDVLWTQD